MYTSMLIYSIDLLSSILPRLSLIFVFDDEPPPPPLSLSLSVSLFIAIT